MNKELREFRRLERVCLEQAALSTMDLARGGLLKVADDCRLASEAIEAQSPRRPFASAEAGVERDARPSPALRPALSGKDIFDGATACGQPFASVCSRAN